MYKFSSSKEIISVIYAHIIFKQIREITCLLFDYLLTMLTTMYKKYYNYNFRNKS